VEVQVVAVMALVEEALAGGKTLLQVVVVVVDIC
jgi:hypothetical protein